MQNLEHVNQEIFCLADGMQEALVRQRRDLHRYPEPGWTEFRTAALVAETLTRLGYTVATGKDAIEPAAMMGVPSNLVLQAAQQRAVEEGADADWVE